MDTGFSDTTIEIMRKMRLISVPLPLSSPFRANIESCVKELLWLFFCLQGGAVYKYEYRPHIKSKRIISALLFSNSATVLIAQCLPEIVFFYDDI